MPLLWTAVERARRSGIVRAAQILIESCDDVERALPEFSKVSVNLLNSMFHRCVRLIVRQRIRKV